MKEPSLMNRFTQVALMKSRFSLSRFVFFVLFLSIPLAGEAASAPAVLEGAWPGLITDTLEKPFIGKYTYGHLLWSFGIILLTFIFRNVLTRQIFARLKQLAARTKSDYDDRLLEALEKPVSLFFLFFGLYLAIAILPIEDELFNFFTLLFRGASTLLVFWGILRFLDVVADIMVKISDLKGSTVGAFVPLIKKAVRVFVIIVGVIMVIDNLGYSVGGILATLGLGGAAFAFAAKDTIANLYGSFALAMDRPFKVGDWIIVGDRVDGDVEEIGLRSTKIRTWPKTVLSIPNNVLANEMINNWSQMPKRRIKQIVGVDYATPTETMAALVEDIRQLLREDEGVNQEFILVNFTDFGESSLNILVYYFTTTTAWLEHMDIRQRVNLKIMDAIAARGSSIAFPTRTVHLEGELLQKLVPGGKLPGDAGPTLPH